MEKKEMLPEEELEQAAGGDGWKPGASASAVEFSPFAVPIRRYITEAKSLGYPKNSAYSYAFSIAGGSGLKRAELIAFVDKYWLSL